MTFYSLTPPPPKVSLSASCLITYNPLYFTTLRKAQNYKKKHGWDDTQVQFLNLPGPFILELAAVLEKIECNRNDLDEKLR